jgi:hypothetical protein
MALIAGAGNALFEGAIGFVVRMRRKLMPVQHDLRHQSRRDTSCPLWFMIVLLPSN